jgi:hypothetical protein
VNRTSICVRSSGMSRAFDSVSYSNLYFTDAYSCDRAWNHSDSNLAASSSRNWTVAHGHSQTFCRTPVSKNNSGFIYVSSHNSHDSPRD